LRCITNKEIIMSWNEKLVELDRAVQQIIKSPYAMLSTQLLDIVNGVKDDKGATEKIEEMLERSLEATRLYAEGTMTKKGVEIVLARYKKVLENYADVAKIKAANKAAESVNNLFMNLLDFIGKLMTK